MATPFGSPVRRMLLSDILRQTVASARRNLPRPLDYYDCRVGADPMCQEVNGYMVSEQYERDLREIARNTAERLGYATLRQGDPLRARTPLVIFDIDDTLITTNPARRTLWLSRQPPSVRSTFPEGFLPPLEPMVALYHLIRQRLGYNVVLLTGRYDTMRAPTLDNLSTLGIVGFDELIMRSPAETNMPAALYKTARRKELHDRGYDIVASIGDQMSDISGPYTGLAVKLPNPMYHIG